MFLPILALAVASLVHGNFPPTPSGVKTLKSKYHEGVTISYKKPGLCETTPGVKSYSGYVHLPPGLLSDINGEVQDYPINTFFWFFESRKDPHNAPLSIWLNGGPGGSSMIGLLQENGPCFIGADSNSTYLNPWSWNNEVNMLYLDQPAQVGFSYDVLTNVTVNLAAGEDDETFEGTGTQVANFTNRIPEQNNTFLIGTMGSQNSTTTANSTTHAAHALWHFAQTWFSEFPAYKPHDDRVKQNEKIKNGTIKEKGTHYIHLDTLGIVNGLLGSIVQYPAYAQMAYNNTYGIELITEAEYENFMYQWSKPGGCKEKLLKCQKQAEEEDPNWQGDIPSVIECFQDLQKSCPRMEEFAKWRKKYNSSWFDVAHPTADPTPEPYMHGFLNQGWVLEALGVPVNFSWASNAVAASFGRTSDPDRAGPMQSVSYLLDSGVKVAMMYGDRDLACNWLGGEAASLAIEYSGSEKFRRAGYAPIISSKGIGGFVRQHGNFSFSRVFQAGHEVPWYQPEVSYHIFRRALFNKDISTGLLPVCDHFSTIGFSSTFQFKNKVPERLESRCYILMRMTCTDEQYATVLNGTAVIKDFLVVGNTESGIEEGLLGGATQHILINEGRPKSSASKQ
ncbi:putative lysosomal protective protein precursor [Leptodontidium sp. 2 PMI_412]|nr:putative lysosomal protective protein precursor [Leptodontidium sp. 2 PMI_412]